MAKFQNIHQLAQDRELTTVEMHISNDFYGHAAVLKEYIDAPVDYSLKAVIEHGVHLHADGWEIDLNSPLPSMITLSSNRHKYLNKQTKKKLYSLGPFIHYASPYLSDQDLEKQVRHLGNNLLVFPAHSTHWVDVVYNIHQYCEKIEQIGKDFDSIRICLYWKDILRGAAEIYSQYGFECVTAGHMYDKQFLPRLKSIIQSATITTSNQITTAIGYCISMGKPHFLMESEYKWTSPIKKFLDECTDLNFNNANIVRKAFETEPRSDISSNQLEIVKKFWGLGEEKSKERLIEILQESEELYRKIHFVPFDSDKPEVSIDSYNGNWSEIIGKIANKMKNFPRRVPGVININDIPIYYADFHSFYEQSNQIFMAGAYGFHCQNRTPLILDCGAHIGLASLYFASEFPEAKIMAFEADP